MRFHCDDYFHIGYEHVSAGKPCQDYAISGLLDDAAFGIVADGCSTGGMTDVGARLMGLSSAAAIREHWSREKNSTAPEVPQEVNMNQKIILGGVREALRLNHNDMLATTLYVYASRDGAFAHVRGDGVVASVHKDGSVELTRYDWANSIPFYPAYEELDDSKSFVTAHGGNLSAGVYSSETWSWNAVDSFKELTKKSYSISVGIKGITQHFSANDVQKNLSFIAVFTDGVCQIDEVDWKDAVLDLLAFKNMAGAFAKRRMIRFIKKAHRDGKGPLDDIAFAVVQMSSNEQLL